MTLRLPVKDYECHRWSWDNRSVYLIWEVGPPESCISRHLLLGQKGEETNKWSSMTITIYSNTNESENEHKINRNKRQHSGWFQEKLIFGARTQKSSYPSGKSTVTRRATKGTSGMLIILFLELHADYAMFSLCKNTADPSTCLNWCRFTYTQIFFNSNTTILHNLQLIGSMVGWIHGYRQLTISHMEIFSCAEGRRL